MYILSLGNAFLAIRVPVTSIRKNDQLLPISVKSIIFTNIFAQIDDACFSISIAESLCKTIESNMFVKRHFLRKCLECSPVRSN
jgi:hypothetical protein